MSTGSVPQSRDTGWEGEEWIDEGKEGNRRDGG